MTWSDVEAIFNRSLAYAFTKKKLLFLFPFLLVCGLLIVLCRALMIQAGEWVVLSLTFLPIFLCSGLMMAAGTLLTRVHHNEVNGIKVSYRSIISESWELLIGASYLALPLILSYLLLWTLMGVFYLLREIPQAGEVIGVLFSFGPFLLVLGSLLLSVVTLAALFFVTPHLAASPAFRMTLAKDLLRHFSGNVFSNIALFTIALIPLACAVGLLSLAAHLTGASFLITENPLSIALAWFFIMIPFSALLAPSIIFFFNFAVESHLFLQEKASCE